MNEEMFFFADENIPTELIKWFEEKKILISGIVKENLFGAGDEDIIRKCFQEKRIILTQDNDFGKIIFTQAVPFFSIIYLRPGHFNGLFHVPTIESIVKHKKFIREGTLIVGQRRENKIKIRIKHIEFNL